MSDPSTKKEGVLVFAFVTEGAASEAMQMLAKARQDKAIEYWDAAVIRVDEKGRYYFNETQDMSTAQGGGIGALVGGLLGLPFGPAAVVLGAGLGASLGAFVTGSDAGISDDALERVGRALMSGNSALVVVPSRDNLTQIREYGAEEETEAAIRKLTAGIAEQMVNGQNAAYHITAAGRSVSCHPLEADNAFARLLNP